jgi:acyl-CoA dehydrogenase
MFGLSNKQQDVRREAREFAQSTIEPVAQDLYVNDEYPGEILQQLGTQRLPGLTLSQEYGGLGYGHIEWALVTEELAAALMPVASALSVHLTTAELIERYGSDAQKAAHLDDMAQFQTVGAHGVTEQQAGNDKQRIETTAEPDGDEWIINGHKRWVTNFEHADIMTLFAKTGEASGRSDDITAFVVSTDQATVEKQWDTLGLHGVQPCEVTFTDVRVPDEQRLGKQGQALDHLSTVTVGAINYAARGVGIARAAQQAASNYASNREQFGHPIGDFQGLRWKIADMAIRTDAARLLTLQAARHADAETAEAGGKLSMAKVFASEASVENASEAIQIYGGIGYTSDTAPSRYLRDAKLLTVGGGGNEIHRNTVADTVMDS